MPKLNPEIESFARIMVIGIGGSGKNAINHMINSKVKGVSFICMNTDTQDLHHSLAEKKIHIGKNLTKGLGAGMNPEIGKKAAEETKSEIQDTIKGADMIFIACGMGGGTGTGAAPIIARAAKEQGILTVAVVTKPFFFEGNHRMKIAEKGIEELAKEVDAIIIIPNDKLIQLSDKTTNFKDAFANCDNVLRQAVEGISDLITTPGIINVDFADIRAIMSDAGSALMGIGLASGDGRAPKAALQAINSPLLEISINGAKGVLFAISGGDDITIHEIQEAAKIITESIDKDAKVIFGTIHDDKLKKGELKVTVIATSFTNDLPRKNLFTGTNVLNQTIVKEENADKVVKEIHNTIQNSNKNNNTTNNTDFLKRIDKKPEVVEEIIIDDDGEDWSAIPAFLRRKKN
ncbi:cell division protein FtsZ [Candidatus Nomurabacteria bacterium CG_4_10_14_0_2_um_filter_30_12]|uniref:Cell division protein FtsZ n=2 Tax=Candidatus Nomuraibacteriota TaxID=1752729 RepID=A0A1J4UZJ8_9BACT|nr:MAG: cell division protein FtsZ [Candidatus Nomurabacteria bacterium CG1_02_31_12]PIZ87601.1 MAG: cell division protein FtsZ [Candidatus Nomurabacteria bacterium CG_4_10_14_0_2_um_filter_30_12]